MSRFYTYEYLRSDWTPYYVGKGHNGRAFSNYHRIKPPKESARIRIQYWADEAEAFEMEKWYIALYGRKDIGTGILRNLTDGGEGPTGAVRTEETRRKIGDASRITKNALGHRHSEETRRKMSKPKSEETRRKMSKPKSEETRRNMSEASRNRSEEHRHNNAEANRGKKRTEESRRKMSEWQYRRKHLRALGFLPFPLKWQEYYAAL